MPTSLIYIVLSTRGCSPWRPDAVMSTTRGANKSRHRVFKGRRERTTNGKKSTVFPKSYTLSPVNPIPGCISMLRRKENSSGGSRWRPRFRLRYRSVSTSWCRNINLHTHVHCVCIGVWVWVNVYLLVISWCIRERLRRQWGVYHNITPPIRDSTSR